MATCYCPLTNGTLGICGAESTPCEPSAPGTYNATSGVQLCCAAGDQCGANSICRFNTSETNQPPGGSGFYLGGCTDDTFEDPLCRKDCQSRIDLPTEDIVYMPPLNVWSCCGKNLSGAVDCNIPITAASFKISWTPSQFPGPIDEILSPAITTTPDSSPSTTSTFAPSTASTSSVAASSTSLAPTKSSSASLSTGAKAGIGVGAAVGALGIIGLIVAAVIVSRRSRRRGHGASAEQDRVTLQPTEGVAHEKPADASLHELDSAARHEMEATDPVSGQKAQPAGLEERKIPTALNG